MIRFIFPMLLLASTASAQTLEQKLAGQGPPQGDPMITFINEFNASRIAYQHALDSFGPAVQAIQALSERIREQEVQKETLIEWLKQAQQK